MTTHNTQFEHSDVDASVVGHPVDSENQIDPSTVIDSPTDMAAENPPPESATPVTNDAPALHGDLSTMVQNETTELPVSLATPDQEPLVDEQPAQVEQLAQVELPVELPPVQPVEEAQLLPTPESEHVTAEIAPAATQEVIPPFSAFIEEFRQSEFRRGTPLYTPDEPFVPFTPAANAFAAAGELAVTDEVVPSSPLSEVAPEAVQEVPVVASPQDVAQGETVTEPPAAPQPPAERPVSPLLRPASRLRIPRHGITRHREEPVEPKVEPAPAAITPAPAPTEPAAEPQRPARRYRFDRPANGAAVPAPAPAVSLPTPRPEEPKESTRVQAAVTRSEHSNGTEAKQPVAEVQPMPVVQEPVVSETPIVAPLQPPPVEHGRRRHAQDRQREKEPLVAAVPTPVAEVVLPAVQQVLGIAQQEEIAPEDLPPLEYAELQKASTRRRRRHRSSSTAAATAATPIASVVAPPVVARPVVSQPVPVEPPVVPMPVPVPAPVVPAPAPVAARVPTPPVAMPNSYTIVSGYTVNQMNQGNELAGPFMGPEPSPARGSLISRDARSVRAEVQRPAAYPAARATDPAHSTASINQLANVVAQAIQAQTDRMVAELRRANQSPTNVSVTLPPFPSTERVGVFVDVANLLYSARTLRIGVDFGKLLDFLRGNRRLIRAQAYCPTSPQPGDEQMFLQAVKGLGYRITTKNYKTFSSGAKKADLDLDLCMDVVRLVDGRAVDCIVLVSGDSDFMPMLEYCSERGVRVEVAAFDEAMSQTLRQSCDLFINLSMLEEIRS